MLWALLTIIYHRQDHCGSGMKVLDMAKVPDADAGIAVGVLSHVP